MLLREKNDIIGATYFPINIGIPVSIGEKRNLAKIRKLINNIRPIARKGYGSIAHETKPNGLLTRGP